MPRFSVVVPTFNGADHIEECLSSVLSQGFEDVEVIVADDMSTDGTVNVVRSLARRDARIRLLVRAQNGGTLRSRRDGVLASTGDYVLLLDQDDALVPGALVAIDRALGEHDPDILHFGVRVVAESEGARAAAAGMEGFLTPTPRRLKGAEILRRQFAQEGGFDWHVHHRALRGELARRAWGAAEDTRLTLSDDLYASFMLCSFAQSYVALPDSAWYEYHLGRGETFGSRTTVDDVRSISERDREGLSLVSSFARSGAVARDDWDARVADVRDRLIEHVMNEFHDGLDVEDQARAIDDVLAIWPADAVAGELYRFVRDRAYALFDGRAYPGTDDELHRLVRDAHHADALVCGEGSERYRAMKSAAERHLCDLETLAPERKAEGANEPRTIVRRLLGRLRRS